MKGNMPSTPPHLKPFKRATSVELSNWYMGSLTTNLAESRDTNGAFCLVEGLLAPGHEPPPPVHSREDELFYALEGQLDAYVGRRSLPAEPGDCIFLPRFIPHAFVIRSFRLRMVALFTPAGLEEAFRSMNVPARDLQLPPGARTYSTSDAQQIAERLGAYGVHVLTRDEIASQMPLYPTPSSSVAAK